MGTDVIENDAENIEIQDTAVASHSVKLDVITRSKDSNIEKPFSNKKNNMVLYSNKEIKAIPDTVNILDLDVKGLNSQKDFKNNKSATTVKQYAAKSDVNVSTKDLNRKVFIKDVKEPVAGTSNVKKRRKSSKSEDELIHEDMRNLTQCIVINSLNTIEDLQDGAEDVFEDALTNNESENECILVPNVENEDQAVQQNIG